MLVNVHRYLKHEWQRRHGPNTDNPSPMPPFDMMKTIEVRVPQQSNHSDCGVYMLHYIELFANEPFKFKNITTKVSPIIPFDRYISLESISNQLVHSRIIPHGSHRRIFQINDERSDDSLTNSDHQHRRGHWHLYSNNHWVALPLLLLPFLLHLNRIVAASHRMFHHLTPTSNHYVHPPNHRRLVNDYSQKHLHQYLLVHPNPSILPSISARVGGMPMAPLHP